MTPARPLVRLLALAGTYRRACLTVVGLQVLALVLGLAGIRLIGLAIDVLRQALSPGAPAPRWPWEFTPPATWPAARVLVVIGALVLTIAAARALLTYAAAITVGKLLHLRLVPELRTRVFNRLAHLNFRFFDQNASGSIINRLTSDVQSVRAFIDGVLLPGVVTTLSLALYVTYMVQTQPYLTAACLAPTPVVWLLSRRFSRWAGPAYKNARRRVDDLLLVMSEGIAGMQVTKVFGREANVLEKFRGSNRAVVEEQRQIITRVSRYSPTIQFIGRLNLVILLSVGGILVAGGGFRLGDLIVFAALLQQSAEQVAALTGIMNTLQQTLAASGRVFEVLDAPLVVASPAAPVRPSGFRGEVCFRNVSFAHGDRSVLRDIELTIEPGQRLAIFGVTGSGKSTLLQLIPRFHDPTSGSVAIDGIDVRALDLQHLRQNIGVVFQDNVLFRSTVAENIAFGHPGAPRERVEHAARIAGAHEFIVDLPNGYDTGVAEGAVNLSGGQRQRIAIARALLLEPPILLLDDPTSAVDAHTEHEVLNAMTEAMRGRTTVVVANRLTTLKLADLIVVLDKGRVVQRGTHEQLMAQDGLYFRAAALQAADIEEAV